MLWSASKRHGGLARIAPDARRYHSGPRRRGGRGSLTAGYRPLPHPEEEPTAARFAPSSAPVASCLARTSQSSESNATFRPRMRSSARSPVRGRVEVPRRARSPVRIPRASRASRKLRRWPDGPGSGPAVSNPRLRRSRIRRHPHFRTIAKPRYPRELNLWSPGARPHRQGRDRAPSAILARRPPRTAPPRSGRGGAAGS